jgi:hypothetical protein
MILKIDIYLYNLDHKYNYTKRDQHHLDGLFAVSIGHAICIEGAWVFDGMVVRAAGKGVANASLRVGHGDETSRLTRCNDVVAVSGYQNKRYQVFEDRQTACCPNSDAEDFCKFT